MNKIKGLDEARVIIERGFSYWAELPKIGGSVQYGLRPVIIIQNDKGNINSPNVVIVPITSKGKKWLPTHVDLSKDYIAGLPKDSIALCESPMTIPKQALKGFIDIIEGETLRKIDNALKIELNLGESDVVSRIKGEAREIANNIKHYNKTLDEVGEYLPKNIVEQTKIKIRLEFRKLEQYCLRQRLNISEFINTKEGLQEEMSYSYIDRKVIAL